MRPLERGLREHACERGGEQRAPGRMPRDHAVHQRTPRVVVHRRPRGRCYCPATLDVIEAITPLAVANCSVPAGMPCRRAIHAKSV
jgi:hypothetical protein